MKVIQTGFSSRKNAVLKGKLLLITVLFCFLNANAQVTIRIEPGVLLKTDSENLGLLFNIEPKVKTSKNTAIGLRFGVAINPQKIRMDDNLPLAIDELDDHGIISVVPTFDYTLHKKRSSSYVGVGLGYFLFNNLDITTRNNGSSGVLEGIVKNQLGFLLRGGLEIENIRFGVEYNFVQKGNIKIPNGQKAGTIDNSYLGLFTWFTIGGGTDKN